MRGLVSSVRTLEVTAVLNGRPAGGIPQVVDQHLDDFVVELPEGTTGALQLTVAALGADRCQVAVGEGALQLTGPGRRQLELVLDRQVRGCRVQLRRVGKGTGTVTLSDGSRPLDCPADGSAEAPPCEAVYPRDRRVTLSYAGTGLGGWFGACSGHAESCQVTISSGITEVQLDLLRKEDLRCRSDWCEEQWPVPAAQTLHGVWGTAASRVFAVGESGTILRSDGVRWTRLASGWSGRLNAVWTSGPPAVWAVGEGGTILRGEAAPGADLSFTRQQRGGATLYGIWGSGPRDVWAVGAGGTILHWQGADWADSPSPTTATLRGIWGSGPRDLWAVGEGGTILHGDGGGWTAVAIRTRSDFRGVGGSRPGAVWAVGEQGVIWRWDGVLWQPSPSGVTVPLSAVFSSPEAGPWAVGEQGTLLRLNGGIWDDAELGSGMMDPPRRLRSIWGAGPFDVWAVGDAGTILRYRP